MERRAMTYGLVILFLAIVVDRLVGDPDWLWRRLPHPVVWFGKAIAFADGALNQTVLSPSARKRNGVLAIVMLLALSIGFGVVLHRVLFAFGSAGAFVEICIVAVFLAQKSLSDHVVRVADALQSGGLAGGRRAVSMIVGRDPDVLDGAGVCRAAIESLAENFADGVVAPVFWYAVAGLPGLLAYKMLNTADSMIGHRSEKYLYFGWASARLDDVANWPAARLSAFLIVLGAMWTQGRQAAQNAWSCCLRDHGIHRSPNSGWPEASMAGALDIQLAGPRIYAGEQVVEPMMHAAGRPMAGEADIRLALKVYAAACSALGVMILVLAGLSLLC
jgi:adenosylcobinamide-phosphate synthase